MQMCKMASFTSFSSSGASLAGFFDGGDLSEADRLPCARGMVYGLLIIVNGTGDSGVGRGHADTEKPARRAFLCIPSAFQHYLFTSHLPRI